MINLAHFYNYFFLFLLRKMESTVINKKSEIMTIIKNFREEIATYDFKDKESLLKSLKKLLELYEKIVDDEDEDDIYYLKDCINYLNNLFKGYVEKNKYLDKNIKYHGIETVKFLFENYDDYNLYLINCQQYQSFSDKNLLTLNQYLERIRPELIRLVNKVCKVKLVVNFAFRSIKPLMIKETYTLKYW